MEKRVGMDGWKRRREGDMEVNLEQADQLAVGQSRAISRVFWISETWKLRTMGILNLFIVWIYGEKWKVVCCFPMYWVRSLFGK